MHINFEKRMFPCIINDVTMWHLSHGFIWDVVEAEGGRRIGVFYCTLMCGDGLMLHFEAVEGEKIGWTSLYAAMRKGFRMVRDYGNVCYATIPEENEALIRVAERLGLRVVPDGGYWRDGKKILLLKYFNPQNAILTDKPTERIE